ncbi:TPA: M48 family metallopeptidase [Klebsiella oxytoca]|nr:M48 family metallopeptidase [Klebsiella michiganensis]HEC2122850.1 M48 family metallopeptidase [Klebsiella oxytoca]
MEKKALIAVLVISTATMLSGCKNMDVSKLGTSATSVFKAATLSDADVKSMSDAACQEMDLKNAIAPASSNYSKRLTKISSALGNNIDGTPITYKVYMKKDVNAWAMANGCVRVYSGLMDIMTDNEIEGVIGHELGHVSLGHSRKAMQAAYATVAARDAVASAGGTVAKLTNSQLGDIAEGLINSAFSRSQERDADNFSYNLLKKRNIDPKGLVTGFEKLSKLSAGSGSSLFSSHPPSDERAESIRKRISENK